MPNTKPRIGERTLAARRRLTSVRERHGSRPILLTTTGSVNWATGGLSDAVDLTASSDPVWVVVSGAAAVLITSEVEAPRLTHDFDLPALGWEVVAVPWFEPRAMAGAALDVAACRAEDLLSDHGAVGRDVTHDIVRERMVLSEPEREDLRALGTLAARALGAGIDSWHPGRTTDFEVAGVIAHELGAAGATPVCLIVGGDERLRRLRHPLAIGDVINDALMTVVVARRGGLHVAATRVAVRRRDDPIIALVGELAAVNSAVVGASRPPWTWGDATEALATAYERAGRPGAWREHFQGGPIAFEQREFELAPGQVESPYWNLACEAHTAVAWNPSVSGGAKIEETYLVSESGAEWVTATPGWPAASTPDGAAHSGVKVLA